VWFSVGTTLSYFFVAILVPFFVSGFISWVLFYAFIYISLSNYIVFEPYFSPNRGKFIIVIDYFDGPGLFTLLDLSFDPLLLDLSFAFLIAVVVQRQIDHVWRATPSTTRSIHS